MAIFERCNVVFFVAITLPFLKGCAYGVVDYGADPRSKKIFSACYEIVSDSYIYEARCVDINDSAFGGRSFCKGIQSFSAATGWDELPESYEDYLDRENYWNDRLFEKAAFEKQRKMLALVPAETKMVVSKILKYPWGESGHKWVMRANLMVRGLDDAPIEVEIPTIGLLAYGETWIESEFMDFPEIKSKFAKKSKLKMGDVCR